MKKIFPLPDDEKFFFEVYLFQTKDQLAEWVEDPSEYPEGLYSPNEFTDNEYFKVGSFFLLRDNLDLNNLVGLAADAAMSYAALLTSFSNFETMQEQAEFCRNTIIESTRFVLKQLMDLDDKQEIFY